jgi:hypothetical protein
VGGDRAGRRQRPRRRRPGRIAAAAAGARFPASAPRLYGDGRAAERIARALAAGSVCARRYDVAP